MRERSDDAEADVSSKGEPRRIDLSVPQVAGSALAAVVAAKLASSFGVYGTIAGAGLISVVATCGGSVLQHFFRRTGEQIRVKRTVTAVRIGGRTVAVPAAVSDAGPVSTAGPAPAPASAAASGDFTEGTVYRARTRGWRRPLIAAALVFGVTMAGITAYEVASGQSLSGGRSTTVGSAFTGHHESAPDSGESGGSSDSEDAQDGRDPGDSAVPDDAEGSDDSKGSGSGGDTPAATPSGSPEGGVAEGGGTEDGGTASSPEPTPDATGEEGAGGTGAADPDASATAPEPGASSRSGTDGPGQDGPAAQ
ncbi:hypothetical protein G3I32_03520 [Streptomyces coelicoflavus]|uniref:Uncharacterized protein n=1 Tax=Streptomyces coelicoflavus TaxID=285562 RepID=A0A7K3PDJ8_9ACTN|nr:hypothetical protein [Streptomyces coelicoflavus]NEB07952.1 hypothetical protein [Streptomyces coelicoflavus]